MADALWRTWEAAGIEWPQGVAAKDTEPAVPMSDDTRSSGEAIGIEQPQDQGQPATAGQTVAVAQRIPLSAYNGYFSEGNVGGLERGASIRTVATGRQKHNQPQVAWASGPPPEEATVKERMA